MSDNIFIFYHSGCSDGSLGGAIADIFFSKYSDYKYAIYPLYYGEKIKVDCNNKTLIFIDIIPCNKNNDLKKISEEATEFIVLDHHEPNFKTLDGINISKRSQLDNNRSGCMIAWDFFFGEIEPPEVVKYIQEGDLYRFELPGSREFVRAFNSSIPPTIQERVKHIDDPIDEYVKEGKVLLKYDKINFNNFMKYDCKDMAYGNDKGCIINLHRMFASNFSDYVLKLRKDIGFVICWSMSKSGNYKYSLRSKEGVDVSLIANDFGGGGHRQASGFSSDKSPNELF